MNSRFFLVLAVLTLRLDAATLQTAQTFNLHPGWNAIYLEVQPADASPSRVFDGIPLESLWTYAGDGSNIDFIQNPNDPIANRSQWRLFVPTNRVESFQNSLHVVHGNRAYLVDRCYALSEFGKARYHRNGLSLLSKEL